MSTPMDSNWNSLSVAAAAPFASDFRGGDKLVSVLADDRDRPAPVIVAVHVAIAPPARRRGSWHDVMDRAGKLMMAVIVGALVIGQSSFSALAQQAGDRPRLFGWASPLTSGEPAPLGLTLRGQTDDAIVMITGLVPGMTLSVGSKIAVDTWQVPATALRNAWIVPPTNFIGVVDLVAELHLADRTIADRQGIKLEWQAAIPVTSPTVAADQTPVAPPSEQPASSPQRDADEPSAEKDRRAVGPPHEQNVTNSQRNADEAPLETDRTAVVPPREQTLAPSRQLDADEIAVLLKRGETLMRNGDLAAARVVLQRAAEAKSAEAALTLGKTYDPAVLRVLKLYNATADVAMARSWYEKAKEIGSAEALRRLESLARAAR
jgi:hypothetical protein